MAHMLVLRFSHFCNLVSVSGVLAGRTGSTAQLCSRLGVAEHAQSGFLLQYAHCFKTFVLQWQRTIFACKYIQLFVLLRKRITLHSENES